MKIAAFSDSHTLHEQVEIPGAEVLIFAGDMNNCRDQQDVTEFNTFLGSLTHKHKIVVAGNHDYLLAEDSRQAKELLNEAVYLQDEMVVINGVSIYGSPWQPSFNDRACDAFALPRGIHLQEKWRMIPAGVDILVTHAPPAGIMDMDGPVSHGCFDLAEALKSVQPRFHVFGHIHSEHGVIRHAETTYINCNVQAGGKKTRPALLFSCPPLHPVVTD
ncbi:MAG TPA: metallophosphoesterase, partial [Desulfobulbaceae bacterium]|nr:metallophosphoesterase [Desulfobulbaceae bacterium]